MNGNGFADEGREHSRMTVVGSGPFGDFALRLSPKLDELYRDLAAIYKEVSRDFTEGPIQAPERFFADDLMLDIRQFLTILYAVKMVRGPEGLLASEFLRGKLKTLGQETITLLQQLKAERGEDAGE
jgi:hypothetical protein